MDVVLTVAGKVIIDNQRNLLHINSARPDISRNQHARIALTEVLHNAVALLLRHFAVHARNGKVGLAHLLGEPVDLAASVAEDDGLGDCERVVEIAESVEFPFLLLDGDKVLLETLESEFVTLDEDTDRVGHEFGRHVEDIVGEGSGDDHYLGAGRQVAIHIVNLLAEAAVEQLVGLIKNQHLDVAGPQIPAPNHIRHTSRRTRDNMLSIIQLPDVFTNVRASDASVALNVHVVSKGHNDGLNLGRQFASGRENQGLGLAHGGIDDLEDRDTESGRLTGTGLRLSDGVAALANLDNGTTLDGGGRLVAVSVDAAEEVLLQVHSLDYT